MLSLCASFLFDPCVQKTKRLWAMFRRFSNVSHLYQRLFSFIISHIGLFTLQRIIVIWKLRFFPLHAQSSEQTPVCYPHTFPRLHFFYFVVTTFLGILSCHGLISSCSQLGLGYLFLFPARSEKVVENATVIMFRKRHGAQNRIKLNNKSNHAGPAQYFFIYSKYEHRLRNSF